MPKRKVSVASCRPAHFAVVVSARVCVCLRGKIAVRDYVATSREVMPKFEEAAASSSACRRVLSRTGRTCCCCFLHVETACAHRDGRSRGRSVPLPCPRCALVNVRRTPPDGRTDGWMINLQIIYKHKRLIDSEFICHPKMEEKKRREKKLPV